MSILNLHPKFNIFDRLKIGAVTYEVVAIESPREIEIDDMAVYLFPTNAPMIPDGVSDVSGDSDFDDEWRAKNPFTPEHWRVPMSILKAANPTVIPYVAPKEAE